MASSFEEELKEATSAGPNRKTTGVVVIAADKTGKIRYLNAQGTTSINPETASPITPDNTFWIASCTKLMTTVAAMQCVEKGLLTLDDDIATVLPEWESRDILVGFDTSKERGEGGEGEGTGEPVLKKATKKLTLRHLLTHSSGMGYEFLAPLLTEWRKWKGGDFKKGDMDIKECLMPLLFEPGEGWNYGVGIDWAGQMVERVNNNITLGQYFQTHIWSPLNMTSTTFRPTQHPDILKRMCDMTEKLPSSGELVPSPPFRTYTPKDELGGGGLYSSPNDYIKLLISLLKNDGTLLKPETVHKMFEPQLPDDKYIREALTDPLIGLVYRSGVIDTRDHAWNFGLGGLLNMEDVDGVCAKGTMTWGGLPNLFWWIDPTSETCGLYASQLIPPGDPYSLELAVKFRREMFKEISKA